MKVNFYFLTVTVFLISAAAAFSQSGPYKVGEVKDAEVAMRVYDQDTSAAAVVLSDHGNTYITSGQSGMKLVFERHTRIKILKKSGYEWANVSIPFYQKNGARENVHKLQGFTYNMEGGKVVKHKLELDGMHEEKLNENWYLKKLTMPQVKEGSVIDYAYTVSSDFMFNLRSWEFQFTIPVVHSEYKVQFPSYLNYNLEQQGYLNLDVSKKAFKANNLTYHFVKQNAPALRPEKYITTMRDYQSRVDFELQSIKFPDRPLQVIVGDWEQVTKDLLEAERFGQQLNRRDFFKNEVAEIAVKYTNPKQQMAAVHDLVKSTVKWNNIYSFGSSGPVRRAFEKRTGNSADINLLLIAMLRDAGLDAAPVLLSTRENGRVPLSPMLTKFNYVIAHVKVGGVEYLLDATDPLLPAGMLPVHCLNGRGRLIKKDDQRWVDLVPSATDLKFYSADVSISANGTMVGKATESSSGYNALRLRKEIKEVGEEKYAEKISNEIGNLKIVKPSFGNTDYLEKALSISYSLTVDGTEQPGDVIYLNPMMGQGEKENPFKLADRIYPVDLAVPIDHTYICRFALPDDYVIDDAPKNAVVTLPENGGKFMYMIEKQGNTIQVTSKISVLKPVYSAPEYPYLKEFYNLIVAKHAEQIVLKKVTAL
jgi:transglutaminase-like putative cysteine protease